MDILWKSSILDLPQDNHTSFNLDRVIKWKKKKKKPQMGMHVAT